MKNSFVLSVVTAVTFAGAVQAGSIAPLVQEATPVVVMEAPAVVMSGDWTGGYVGASLTYATGDAENPRVSGELSGYGVTGFAGYQHDFGSFVMGGELEYLTGSVSDDTGSFDFDSSGRAKLRLGYDAGQTLVYGVVGATAAKASFAGQDIDAYGYLLGAGVDYRVTQNITVGGEVISERYDDFNDNTAEQANITTAGLRVSYNF